MCFVIRIIDIWFQLELVADFCKLFFLAKSSCTNATFVSSLIWRPSVSVKVCAANRSSMLESLTLLPEYSFPKRCWRVASRWTPLLLESLLDRSVSYDFHSLHSLWTPSTPLNRSSSSRPLNESSPLIMFRSICIENEELIDFKRFFCCGIRCVFFTAKLPRATVAILNKIKKNN